MKKKPTGSELYAQLQALPQKEEDAFWDCVLGDPDWQQTRLGERLAFRLAVAGLTAGMTGVRAVRVDDEGDFLTATDAEEAPGVEIARFDGEPAETAGPVDAWIAEIAAELRYQTENHDQQRYRKPQGRNAERDAEIARLYAEGVKQETIAKRFGISVRRVQKIISRG